MTQCTRLLHHMWHLTGTLLTLLVTVIRFLRRCLRPAPVLAAENLFLHTQLAQYQERHVKPRRATHGTRLALVWLARWFDWRQALAMVQPQTFLGWHRQGFRLFWHWKSRLGRPPIPLDLQALIRRIAREHPMWSEERMANALLLKLSLRVSPRTVRTYMPQRRDHSRGQRVSSQRWQTFVRHHAQAIVACAFCVVVTATFRLLDVFIVMEHATRRILHCHVTAHPTASWTLQQLREALPADRSCRFLIHDRDRIFSQQLDQRIRNQGVRVLKTPMRSPRANALGERLLGTRRQECLDLMIPLTVDHRRCLLTAWVQYDNASRPLMSLGPGIPQPLPPLPAPLQAHRHHLPERVRVVVHPMRGGLHHAYELTAS